MSDNLNGLTVKPQITNNPFSANSVISHTASNLRTQTCPCAIFTTQRTLFLHFSHFLFLRFRYNSNTFKFEMYTVKTQTNVQTPDLSMAALLSKFKSGSLVTEDAVLMCE